MTHYLEFENDALTPGLECTEPDGSACRTGCAESCDAWAEGSVCSEPGCDDHHVRHVGWPGCHHPQTGELFECSIVSWYEDEPFAPVGVQRVAIEVNEGFTWSFAEGPSGRAEP